MSLSGRKFLLPLCPIWRKGVCELQAVNICRFIKIKDIGYWTALCAYRTPQTAIGKSLSNNTISTLKIYHD